MFSVTILSDRPQTTLLSRIAYALEKNLCENFVLREHIGRSELAIDRGILVVKDLKNASRKARFGSGVVPVIESSCRSAVKLIGKHGMCAVCCGMSPRDTLIAESIDSGRSLLCLQRTIPTLSGTRDPCVIVALTDSNCDTSSLLLTSGALLAAGINEGSEIRI